jgi:hypothetical protein
MKKKFIITIIMIVILFFALSQENQAADLNGTWHQIAVTGKIPYPRGFHSAIHDPINNRMIIFGGWSSTVYDTRNDVYSFDLINYTGDSLVTSGGPPGRRAGHVAVYDSLRHRMIVFGGSDWWWTWYHDTWALNLSTNIWTELTITDTLPSSRYGSCGIYDSFQDRLIIFGGHCGSVGSDSTSKETWAFNLATQQWDSLNTTNNPSPHEFATAVFDKANYRMIICGGHNITGDLSDVWALNLSTYEWTQLADYQNAVIRHAAAFDPQRNYMIAVTGNSLYSHGQAAVFSTSANKWLSLSVSVDTPSVRYNSCAIWDPNNNRVVMFGGALSGTVDWNETWEFSVDTVQVGIYEHWRGTPNSFALYQNYPNPFNPTTNISFTIPSKSFVTLKVYDLLGRDVATLVSKELPAGTYPQQWNAAGFASGVYLYRLQAGKYSGTKKLILMK